MLIRKQESIIEEFIIKSRTDLLDASVMMEFRTRIWECEYGDMIRPIEAEVDRVMRELMLAAVTRSKVVAGPDRAKSSTRVGVPTGTANRL